MSGKELGLCRPRDQGQRPRCVTLGQMLSLSEPGFCVWELEVTVMLVGLTWLWRIARDDVQVCLL